MDPGKHPNEDLTARELANGQLEERKGRGKGNGVPKTWGGSTQHAPRREGDVERERGKKKKTGSVEFSAEDSGEERQISDGAERSPIPGK